VEVRPIKILTLKAILLLEKDELSPKELRVWLGKEINQTDQLEIILAAQELGHGI
jgi:hypothetical protein